MILTWLGIHYHFLWEMKWWPRWTLSWPTVSFLCSCIFDLSFLMWGFFFFNFFFYEKLGVVFLNDKLNSHLDPFFLEFKVGRGKVWLNPDAPYWDCFLPNSISLESRRLSQLKISVSIKKCPIQSTLLMSVLCYADHDFFLFCLMKNYFKTV